MQVFKATPARRFITSVAAAATALALLTAAAVPAHADRQSDDLAKALAAIAAIVIVGKTINDNNKHRREPVVVPQQSNRDRGHRDDRWDRDNRRQSRALPQECAVEVRTHRRSKTLYTEHCLARNGITRHLPQQCATTVYMRNRPMTAYPETCLEDAGFISASNRRHR